MTVGPRGLATRSDPDSTNASPSAQSPIRVLLLSNHSLVRSGLRLLLEKQPGISIVGEASQLNFVDCAPESPNIVLIDLDSIDGIALDLLPKLLSRAKDSQALILTSSHDSEIHQRLVRLGAMGVVLKELPVEMLIEAIKKVHAGEIWMDRSMMAGLLRAISPAKGACEQDTEAPKIATLTKREREIVALFGQGLNKKRVAERLFISETTVRHHLTAIFDKLDVPDRFELVFYAYRHGLAKPPC